MEVQNITNYKQPELLEIGTICNLVDKIDYSEGVMCTVRFIEKDEDIENLYYYYLMANNDEKNTQYDPRFGRYFAFVEHGNPFLLPIAKATIS